MHIHRPAGPCGLAVASTYKTGAHQQRYAIGSYQNVPCLGHMVLKGAQKITFQKTTAPKEWCWTLQPQLLQLVQYSLSGNSRAKKRLKTDTTSISAGLSLPYPGMTQPSRERAQQPPWECSMHPAAAAQQHSRRPHAVHAPQLTSGSKGKPADGCTLLATHCPSPSRSALRCSRRDATAAKMEPGMPKTTPLPLREAQTQYASIVDRCTILQGTGGSTLSCQHAIYPQAASPTWAHTISMRNCSNKWISSNSSSSRTLGWASPSTTQPHHSHTKMRRIPLSHMHT